MTVAMKVAPEPVPEAPAGRPAQVAPYVLRTLTSKALHFSMAEIQSEMHVDRPDDVALEYTRLMMGFLLFHPRPRTIGLGGGSLAKFCFRHVTSARMRVVEINPHVIALRDEFCVPADCERFRVVEADGAHFVRFPPKRSDVLLVDGFDYDGLPRQLCSARFYDDCFDFLMPGGMLVVNLHAAHADYSRHLQRDQGQLQSLDPRRRR